MEVQYSCSLKNPIFSYYNLHTHWCVNSFVTQENFPAEIAGSINRKSLEMLVQNIFYDMIEDFKLYNLSKNGIDELLVDLEEAKNSYGRKKISVYLADATTKTLNNLDQRMKGFKLTFDHVEGLGVSFHVNCYQTEPTNLFKELLPLFKNLKKLIIDRKVPSEGLQGIGKCLYLTEVNITSKLDENVVNSLKSIKSLKLLRYNKDKFSFDKTEKKLFLSTFNDAFKNLALLELTCIDPSDDQVDELKQSLPNTIISIESKRMVLKFEDGEAKYNLHNS